MSFQGVLGHILEGLWSTGSDFKGFKEFRVLFQGFYEYRVSCQGIVEYRISRVLFGTGFLFRELLGTESFQKI